MAVGRTANHRRMAACLALIYPSSRIYPSPSGLELAGGEGLSPSA